MASTVERRYALTRIAVGDYLLPSNDGKTVWRLSAYEDGPSHGLEDRPRDRKFWGYWKWTSPVSWDRVENPLHWDNWAFWGGLCETRAQAIQDALKQS